MFDRQGQTVIATDDVHCASMPENERMCNIVAFLAGVPVLVLKFGDVAQLKNNIYWK